MLPQLTQLLWGEDMITAWGEDLLPNGDDYINNTRAHDKQEALFADATYSITEKLKLNVGLRYAWTKFAFANTNDGPQDLLGGPPSFDNGGLAGGGKSEQPFTPKFNLSYQLTPDDLVYATASKGYRIGGATPPLPPNCGTGFPTSYNSDSLWSYEVGTKDRFLERTLQVSASAFYVDWSNIQQAFYVPACGIQFTTNAGQVISKGFDLESQWQVTRALDLELTVGYTDARFSQTALDANGDVLNVKGDALDLPPWTVTVAAQYDFSVLDRDAFVRADYEFASKRTAPIPNEDPATAFYDPGLVPNPAINQVSMRAGVSIGAWDLALYANNLLNAHPVLNLTHQDSATTLYEATTLRPRTIGMSANVNYRSCTARDPIRSTPSGCRSRTIAGSRPTPAARPRQGHVLLHTGWPSGPRRHCGAALVRQRRAHARQNRRRDHRPGGRTRLRPDLPAGPPASVQVASRVASVCPQGLEQVFFTSAPAPRRWTRR